VTKKEEAKKKESSSSSSEEESSDEESSDEEEDAKKTAEKKDVKKVSLRPLLEDPGGLGGRKDHKGEQRQRHITYILRHKPQLQRRFCVTV